MKRAPAKLTRSVTHKSTAAIKRRPRRSLRTAAVVVSPEPTTTRARPVADASRKATLEKTVDQMLKDAGILETRTKSDWCLREGLLSICQAQNQSLLPLVQRHGPPKYYDLSTDKRQCRHENLGDFDSYKPGNGFKSLCRIIAGQQLAGAAAQAIWRRLLDTTESNLTPSTILELAEEDLEVRLQKPAGLSKAKALSIVDLARHFDRGDLTDDFLMEGTDDEVRNALLSVRGIGPWSCDMYAMFTLERPNVFPLGDFGVRKGVARHFHLRGSGKRGELCPKKDLDRIRTAVDSFAPYHSLLSFYMWKAADTVDFYNEARTLPVSPDDKYQTRKKART